VQKCRFVLHIALHESCAKLYEVIHHKKKGKKKRRSLIN